MEKIYTTKTLFWRKVLVACLVLWGLVSHQAGAQQFTIGAGTASNASTGTVASPFANWWEGSRQQYMYRTTELTGAGMASGLLITDIAFNVTNANAALPHQNFKIWIGETTNTALAAWVPTSQLTLVHGPVTVNPVTGFINFTLTAPYSWQGNNIVVQVFFNNNTNTSGDFGTEYNTNMSVQWTTGLPTNTVRYSSSDGLTEAELLNETTTGTGNTSRPNIRFTTIPPTPCAGTVTGGTAVANPSSFCSPSTTSLSVTGGTGLATGLTYQWQYYNTATSSWDDIPFATSSTLGTSPLISVTTQFRRKITCTNSGNSDFSAPVTFANVLGSIPYASLPYIQDFESWQDKCSTKEIPGSNWVNTPSTGSLSWRRQDQGSTAGWTNPTNNTGNGNMLPISGNGAACFHSGAVALNTPGGQQGWMDLYVDMSSTFKKELRFLYRNRQQFVYIPPVPGADRQWFPVHGDQLEVLLSTDGGLTFPTTLGVFGNETPDSIPPAPVPSAFASSIVRNNWKKIAVKIGNIAPTAVIRFRATTSPILPPVTTGTAGTGTVQTDIGIDDVQVIELKPCSGTPIAGTLYANPRLCEPGTVYLSVVGSEDLIGGQDYVFEWETSADGVNWTTVQGADQPDYTTPVLNDEPYYRRKIVCKNGGSFNYTPAMQIKQIRPTYVPVVPGLAGRYIQQFENWIDGCQDKQLPDEHWKNTPEIGNKSWRNTADVASNVGKWFIGFTAPTSSIAPQVGTGAAAFYSRGVSGQGDLLLHVNLSASTNRKALQFYATNTSGTDNMNVAVSTSGGTSFAPLGTVTATPNPAWNKKGFFLTSNSATTVIRFRGQSGGPPNEPTDQGLDSLVVIDLEPCSTKPRGGEASASPQTFCQATEITISVQKGSDDAAWAIDDKHKFQWQISTDGGTTWTDILNETGASLTLNLEPQPQTPPRQYRRKITCPNGNTENFSTAVTLEFPYPISYAKIPYYNGFEDTWASGAPCTAPSAANLRPVTPINAANDPTNTASPARNQHWRNTGADDNNIWRRSTTTRPWGAGASYARAYPIGTACAAFRGYYPTGSSKGTMDLYVDASGTQMKQIRFRYRNPNRPTTVGTYPGSAYNDDFANVKLSFDNGKNFQDKLSLAVAPAWLPYHINFNENAPNAILRFEGNSNGQMDPASNPEGTDQAIDEVFVVYVNDCATAGALVGGTTDKDMPNTFPDFNFCYFPPYAVFVTGASDETHHGFGYQWEFSGDGGATYTPIAGATDQNYLMGSARVGLFRRKITCTATGNSAYSVPVSTSFANPVTYATLPYKQSFENWRTSGACAAKDTPDDHWKNSPFTSLASWRKQDEGATAGWTFIHAESVPKPVSGQGCAAFHNGAFGLNPNNTPSPIANNFDLFVDCSPAGTKQLRFWYTNPDIANSMGGLGNNDRLQVSYSTDGGINFSQLIELAKQDGWKEYTFNFESTSPSTVIRFSTNWTLDDSDLGIDELKVNTLNACAGTPDGGFTKPSTTSGNSCTTLSLLLFVEETDPNNVQSGVTYQWESSSDGTNWTALVGETNPTYLAAPLFTTHYRRVAKCTASGLTAPSAPYTYYIANSPEYAPLPFKEDFERWGDACDNQDIPLPPSNKIYWRARPFIGDNAWRKTGEEITGQWRDINEPSWLQGGRVIPALGSGAASFHSVSATNRTTGDLELYLDMRSADPNAVKLLKFDYSNPDYPANVTGFTNQDKLDIFLSTDGGFSYGAVPIATYDRTKDLWETRRIVFDGVERPFLNAQFVVLRFRANSDNGGTDIGIDNLTAGVMPKTDVGVVGIEFNRCSPKFGRVVVEVENYGSDAAQNFDVQYTIGGNTYTENFPIRLERFQKSKYEFFTPFQVPGTGSVTISATTKLVGDANAANDSKSTTISIANFAGIPASGVFTENFDSGIPANWRVEGKLNTPSWFSARQNDLLPANVAPEADEFPFNPFQMSLFDATGNGFSNRFVALDDNKGGAARTFDADRLITPIFDLSNHSNIQVSFGSYVSNVIANGLGELIFEYSTDGGNTWTPHDRILGDGDGVTGVAQVIKNYSLPVLDRKGNVRFAFKFNDKGVVSGGAAIDNFTIQGVLVATPIADITTPEVKRSYVNRGTEAHIVYRFDVEAKDANVVLSDVILKTANQEYQIQDFKQSSFRLFASTDNILSANDANIGTSAVVAEGQEISFGCVNYGIAKGVKRYFFFTVDVANAPTSTIGDSVAIQLPVISQSFFTILGDRTGSNFKEGGYQIIVDPNTPPTAEKLVFSMKYKQKDSDPNLTFKAQDFKFADVDPIVAGLDINKFGKLRISTFNTRTGSKFQLNGTDIAVGQEINASDISKFVFIPKTNDASANYASFTFKVFDGRDWSAIDYVAVINVVGDKLFIPTLFTPNNDGKNDRFVVRGGEGTITKLTFKIVDRNNNVMFESSDIDAITTLGWDGTKDGKVQPEGSYMWYIDGTFADGNPIEIGGKKTGIIRLVR